MSTFIWSEDSILPRKFSKNWTSYNFCELNTKKYYTKFKFSIIMSHPTNAVKFLMNAIINMRKLAKFQQNWLRSKMNYWKGMKILNNFWRKSIPIWRCFQVKHHFMNAFQQAATSKKAACTTLRVWTKTVWEFLIKISHWNLTFFTIPHLIVPDFCVFSESISPWKITPVSYNNFYPISRREWNAGTFLPPIATAHELLPVTNWACV